MQSTVVRNCGQNGGGCWSSNDWLGKREEKLSQESCSTPNQHFGGQKRKVEYSITRHAVQKSPSKETPCKPSNHHQQVCPNIYMHGKIICHCSVRAESPMHVMSRLCKVKLHISPAPLILIETTCLMWNLTLKKFSMLYQSYTMARLLDQMESFGRHLSIIWWQPPWDLD